MNKFMMTGIAAVGLCGAVFADVTSANVVGYQLKELNDGKKSYICQTLKNLNTVVGQQTLGDWVPNDDFELDDDSMYLWDEDGNIEGHYTFVRKIDVDGEVVPAGTQVGWYDFAAVDDDWDFSNCLNSKVVPFGTMAMVLTGNGGKMGFSGEVRNEDTIIVLNDGKKTYIGNCSPVDITLGQIQPSDEFELDDDSIYFWDENGNVEGHYTYVRQIDVDGEVVPAGTQVGWYDFAAVDDDWDFSNCLNSKVVKAGDSFMALTGNGASIKIPTALPKAK